MDIIEQPLGLTLGACPIMIMFVKYFLKALFRNPVQIFSHRSVLVMLSMQCAGVTQDRDEVQHSFVFECLQWQSNGITLTNFQAYILQNNLIDNLL